MDAVVGTIQALSDKGEFADLKKFLIKEKNVYSKSVQQVDNVLDLLAAQVNKFSLGYTMLLHSKLRKEITDIPTFLTQAKILLAGAHHIQIDYVQIEFSEICQQYALNLILANRPIDGVLPLQRAVAVLQNRNPHLLTPAHKDFVLMCIKAKVYSVAQQALDTPIYEINPKKSGLQSADYLGYHYYGGVCYIGLKKFEKALEFFQLVLTAPTRSLSMIQVYAMQKYILTSLIAHGENIPLPRKITSHVVLKGVERRTQLYMHIAQSFKRGVDDLRKAIEENHEELKRDKNFGLAKQTITSLARRNIKRLTNTYLILPLAEIAERSKLQSAAEAEQHVLSMIQDGAIFATINQREGTVSFQESPENFDSSSTVQKLDQKIREAEELDRRLRNLDQEIQLEPKFIKRNLASGGGEQRKGGGSSKDIEDMQMQQAMKMSLMEK